MAVRFAKKKRICISIIELKICRNIIELKTNDVEEFGGANRGNGARGRLHVGRARLAESGTKWMASIKCCKHGIPDIGIWLVNPVGLFCNVGVIHEQVSSARTERASQDLGVHVHMLLFKHGVSEFGEGDIL